MAHRLSYEKTTTSTILVLLVLLEAALVLEQVKAAPGQQRNDILAGTEFLSVFINGAMAPVPVPQPAPPASPSRRRGYRRGGGTGHNNSSFGDNLPSESRQSDASIYRISRAPSSPRPMVTRSGNRGESQTPSRIYKINEKSMEIDKIEIDRRDERTTPSTATASTTIGTNRQTDDEKMRYTVVQRLEKMPNLVGGSIITRNNSGIINKNNVNQKVIGVSVTSSVKATPYKVRVEHHDIDSRSNIGIRRSTSVSNAAMELTSPDLSTTTTTTTTTTMRTRMTPSVTPLPLGQPVTQELSNIVSESNRSEFLVEEGSPKTSWRNGSPPPSPPPPPPSPPSSSLSTLPRLPQITTEPTTVEYNRASTASLPPIRDTVTIRNFQHHEESYELPEENSETRETHKEPIEISEHHLHQGRKAGRHYDAGLYNQPPKVYPHETAKMHGKSSRVYGDSSRNSNSESQDNNYDDQASRLYSEPAKIYSEPARVYGEPERVYGEPAKIYSEPARVYGEPAKVYGEPSKVYGSDGRPVERHEIHRHVHQEEPEEVNYEVDEAVSVGSNGNVHGSQIVTEAPSTRNPSVTVSTVPSSRSPPAETSHEPADGRKVGYVVDERNYRKYRVEERTPDGFIVGEYGVVSHDDGSLRGVRYTADGTIDPRLIYDALMKFLAL